MPSFQIHHVGVQRQNYKTVTVPIILEVAIDACVKKRRSGTAKTGEKRESIFSIDNIIRINKMYGLIIIVS